MPEIKLIWDVQSQPSRAIKCLLEAGGVKHEAVHIKLFNGEGPEIKAKLNPGGGIPFILWDGEPVNESASILRFLARACPELNQFYPADNHALCAKIDQALDWNGTTFRKTDA